MNPKEPEDQKTRKPAEGCTPTTGGTDQTTNSPRLAMFSPSGKPQSGPSRQEIATRILVEVDWQSDELGYCQCPGVNRHTGRNAERDCRVILDGAPTIHCVHTSCRAEVAEANLLLRRRIGAEEAASGCPAPRIPTAVEFERRKRKVAAGDLRRRAKANREAILGAAVVDLDSLRASSPIPLPDDPFAEFRLFVGTLFHPDDIIWCGDKYDSGKPKHRRNFKPAREWLSLSRVIGPLTVPSTFKAGSESRSRANVVARRYLVVESDSLTKPQTLALFWWCRRYLKMRAIVDTGGKSLHGWFDVRGVSSRVIEELAMILPELGADPALFRDAQPCRLPGWQRTPGRFQRLLFLEGGLTNE